MDTGTKPCLFRRRVNWIEAQLRATARGCGWHLVTITSEAEDSFVFSLIAFREEFFVVGDNRPLAWRLPEELNG